MSSPTCLLYSVKDQVARRACTTPLLVRTKSLDRKFRRKKFPTSLDKMLLNYSEVPSAYLQYLALLRRRIQRRPARDNRHQYIHFDAAEVPCNRTVTLRQSIHIYGTESGSFRHHQPRRKKIFFFFLPGRTCPSGAGLAGSRDGQRIAEKDQAYLPYAESLDIRESKNLVAASLMYDDCIRVTLSEEPHQ